MSHAIVVVWIGAAALRVSHAADLASWSESRLVTVERPAEGVALPPAHHDDELSSRIEALLEGAKTAGYSADPGTAEKALSSAELLLRGNPELPEAPWLMAEACAEHAALVRGSDPALARILDERARLLGGRRAQAFKDAAAPEAASSSGATFTVEGPLPHDDVYVDGIRAEPGQAFEAGEHHVRVERQGRLAWAGWVSPESSPPGGASGAVVRIAVPGVEPCTRADLERARVTGERIDFDAPVACPEWALARDAGPTRIEVAMCRASSCGPFLPWSRAWGDVFDGRPQPAPERTGNESARRGNDVILWATIGVGAVLAGSFALWQTGAFDREGPPRSTFRFSGPDAR
jgi:hypothetical protein